MTTTDPAATPQRRLADARAAYADAAGSAALAKYDYKLGHGYCHEANRAEVDALMKLAKAQEESENAGIQ